MNKLTKLIIKEFFQNLLIVYLVFLTIGFTIDFFDKIDDLYAYKLKFINIIEFFLLRIPYIFSQIHLYALIISALVTINILIQHNEMLAFFTSGIKPIRLFSIFLILIISLNSIVFLQNLLFTPKLLRKSEKKIQKKMNVKDFTNYSDIFIKHKEGFIFIDLLLPNGNFLINTYFIRLNNNFEVEDVYYARVLERKNNDWIAKDGKWLSLKNNKALLTDEFNFPKLEILQDISKTTYHPDWLTIGDLIKIIRVGIKTGMDITSYNYQLTRKLGSFFYPILLFYLIFPYTLQFGRTKKNKEVIFLGLVFLLSFTIIETFLFRLGQNIGINPLIILFILLIALPLFTLKHKKYIILYNRE
ncbi:MAG: LptF/LptG family permease [Proteobacteria bacterium]|nr:LptF/LptG family permease [Pseudomonadota bacterium]